MSVKVACSVTDVGVFIWCISVVKGWSERSSLQTYFILKTVSCSALVGMSVDLWRRGVRIVIRNSVITQIHLPPSGSSISYLSPTIPFTEFPKISVKYHSSIYNICRQVAMQCGLPVPRTVVVVGCTRFLAEENFKWILYSKCHFPKKKKKKKKKKNADTLSAAFSAKNLEGTFYY